MARAKLEQAGVEAGLIEAAETGAGLDSTAEAKALVELRLKPGDRDNPGKAAARLYRLLASRGFDEETARAAVESVLGTMEHEHDHPSEDWAE